jgi:hypothetical protein
VISIIFFLNCWIINKMCTSNASDVITFLIILKYAQIREFMWHLSFENCFWDVRPIIE